jgi:hypothetical protein
MRSRAITAPSVWGSPGRVGGVLRIDHVVYAVPDLDEAAVRLREAFGLDSVGGRHERWGTANRIVPMGDQYLSSSRRSTGRRRPLAYSGGP